MSTLKVNAIRGTGASSDAISVNSTDGTCTAKLTSINDQPLGSRNILFNTNMEIAQRATSVSSVTSSYVYRTVDRWLTDISGGAAVTESQVSDNPLNNGKSLKINVTTADTSLAADDNYHIDQKLEGYDLQRFRKGTASAKKFSLSFYVKTNKTGTYVVSLRDQDNSRKVSATYTVSDSNWNRYTLTFPADTTGTFNDDNAESLMIIWWLGAGSNYASGSLPTTWAAGSNNEAAGGVNFMDSTSNDFQITNVQLEAGDFCTEYEPPRSYADELARCQRYYQQISGNSDLTMFGYGRSSGTTAAIVAVPLTTPLRASPSLTCAKAAVWSGSTSDETSDAPSVTRWTAPATVLNIQWSSGVTGLTNARCLVVSCANSSTLEMSAEL